MALCYGSDNAHMPITFNLEGLRLDRDTVGGFGFVNHQVEGYMATVGNCQGY